MNRVQSKPQMDDQRIISVVMELFKMFGDKRVTETQHGSSLRFEEAVTVARDLTEGRSEITNIESLQIEISKEMVDIVKAELQNILPLDKNNDTIAKNVAKAIDRLRNNVAHWRPLGDSFDHPKNWENFLGLVCELVYKLYKAFEREI